MSSESYFAKNKGNYDETEEEGDGQLYSSRLIRWLNCFRSLPNNVLLASSSTVPHLCNSWCENFVHQDCTFRGHTCKWILFILQAVNYVPKWCSFGMHWVVLNMKYFYFKIKYSNNIKEPAWVRAFLMNMHGRKNSITTLKIMLSLARSNSIVNVLMIFIYICQAEGLNYDPFMTILKRSYHGFWIFAFTLFAFTSICALLCKIHYINVFFMYLYEICTLQSVSSHIVDIAVAAFFLDYTAMLGMTCSTLSVIISCYSP